MQFMKELRAGVRSGAITCSVRIWAKPHVKPGNRYRMEDGEIEVDSIEQIELDDITPKLARESGFAGVVDLLKIAKHGPGAQVYLVRFHYVTRGRRTPVATRKLAVGSDKKALGEAQRARVVRILERLPEAEAVAQGAHLSLEVRGKRFGYFLADHHGDARVALNCKVPPDVLDALRELAPAHFHVPKYVGKKGWVGLWLDVPKLDWSVVTLALREAYLITAPKKLSASI